MLFRSRIDASSALNSTAHASGSMCCKFDPKLPSWPAIRPCAVRAALATRDMPVVLPGVNACTGCVWRCMITWGVGGSPGSKATREATLLYSHMPLTHLTVPTSANDYPSQRETLGHIWSSAGAIIAIPRQILRLRLRSQAVISNIVSWPPLQGPVGFFFARTVSCTLFCLCNVCKRERDGVPLQEGGLSTRHAPRESLFWGPPWLSSHAPLRNRRKDRDGNGP